MKMIEVVAAIIERDGKILLAQRPAQRDQAGLWEFAGGKVELDESQQQALVWCSPEEALQYPLAPADIPLLEAFMALRAARPAD
ncbi:TPA: NUDIX domain-containing protein [Escherichia coli]|nr:NUDIX domain-containing protein [Escherichia coli]HCJ8909259.1 NUDIX domain-containing protein [Escherichia coli]